MAQRYYEDTALVIVYLVNYPVVTNSNPPRISPAELVCAMRAWLGYEIADCINNAVLMRLRNSRERFLGWSLNPNRVIHEILPSRISFTAVSNDTESDG